MASRKDRIAELERKLAARKGLKEYEKNCADIEREILRLKASDL